MTDGMIDDKATVNTDDSCAPNGLDELPALLPNLQTKLPEKKEKMIIERTQFAGANLVGVMIMAIGPSFSSSGSWSAMCRNRGRRKARVLPGETID